MPGLKSKKTVSAQGIAIPGVDLVQVERVLDFMATHHLEEFEYSQGDLHIRLKRSIGGRNSGSGHAPAHVMADALEPDSQGLSATPSATGIASEPPARPAVPKEELHVIKSPIVGTFYSSPSPEAAPFVKVGDTIQSGQVVCIVEAMKLMNEIEADMGGEIVAALAENGQPVEYGQSLFALRPANKKK
jgi:acetyl-CoA carboxylase biotin carboxyl carrier protein